MRYWELLDKACELRAKAVTFMDANAMASTPINYELCFHYALDQDPDLTQALDAAVAAGLAGNCDHTQELREKFCRQSGDAEIGRSASGLEAELRQLSAVLASAGKGSSAYGRTLTLAADQLARADASPQLRSLIDTVASATRLMNENTKDLEAQVEASTKEVEALRFKMESVRKEGLTDALTGLSNRRSFDEAFAAAVADAQAVGAPLCVLMCDIDHFKKFNDTWGHATGDQVLRLTAQCVSSNVKGRDTAARYGGEEIVVILPKTGLADAMVVAEQIRRTVASRKFVKKSTGESYGSITVSIGGSEFKPGESAADFLARADVCLYAAKHAGRNRVCSEVPADADVYGAAKNKGCKTKDVEPGGSVMELQFDDRQTEICVDPEVTLVDGRLKQLQHWFGLAAKKGLPRWHDSHFDDLSFMRDVLHLYEAQDEGFTFRVSTVGAGLVRILGEDPTGLLLSQTHVQTATLAPSLARVFELIRLSSQMKAPLRTFSKSVHRLGRETFRGESLFLPFATESGAVDYILAATILTQVAAADTSTARVAYG